jgi:hypothetical protein
MVNGNSESKQTSILFNAIISEVEGEDAFVIGWALKHFGMPQGANGVVIASAPP